MSVRWYGVAALGALTVLCGLQKAVAQRATSAPSAETGLAAETAPPPPPGFPGSTSALVFGGSLTTHLQGEWTNPQGGKSYSTVFDDTDIQLFANYQNWLSLNSDIKLERNQFANLQSYYPAANNFLRNEGLTARQLYVTIRPLGRIIDLRWQDPPKFRFSLPGRARHILQFRHGLRTG